MLRIWLPVRNNSKPHQSFRDNRRSGLKEAELFETFRRSRVVAVSSGPIRPLRHFMNLGINAT